MTDSNTPAITPPTTQPPVTAAITTAKRSLSLNPWTALTLVPHAFFAGMTWLFVSRTKGGDLADWLGGAGMLAASALFISYFFAMIAFRISGRNSIAANATFVIFMGLMSFSQLMAGLQLTRPQQREAIAKLERTIDSIKRERAESLNSSEFGEDAHADLRAELNRVDSLVSMLQETEAATTGEDAAVARCMRKRLREMAELDVKFFRELNGALAHTNGSPQMCTSKEQLDRCMESLLVAQGSCDEAIAKYGTLRSGALDELVSAGVPRNRAEVIVRSIYPDEAVDRSRRLREARRDLIVVLTDQVTILKKEWGFWGNDVATLDVTFAEEGAAEAWTNNMVRFSEVAEREQVLIRQLAGLPTQPPSAPAQKAKVPEGRLSAEAPVRW